MVMRPIAVVAFALITFLAGTAAADKKFHAVPKGSHLQLRVVSYDGSVNGALTVEVKNTGKSAAKFTASGLYFVPDGDPDRAPQRLGAVGPMQIGSDGEDRKDEVAVPAGGKVTVVLDVFCIDDHRDAPTSETAFSVGKTRMPKQLAATIATESGKAAADVGGYEAPAAKDAIQSTVWKSRDEKWIRLDGEGAQEAAKH